MLGYLYPHVTAEVLCRPLPEHARRFSRCSRCLCPIGFVTTGNDISLQLLISEDMLPPTLSLPASRQLTGKPGSRPGVQTVKPLAGPGSHYCDNIGRSHASNHVYLVADFAKGVFAQKCHDPDCGGFR